MRDPVVYIIQKEILSVPLNNQWPTLLIKQANPPEKEEDPYARYYKLPKTKVVSESSRPWMQFAAEAGSELAATGLAMGMGLGAVPALALGYGIKSAIDVGRAWYNYSRMEDQLRAYENRLRNVDSQLARLTELMYKAKQTGNERAYFALRNKYEELQRFKTDAARYLEAAKKNVGGWNKAKFIAKAVLPFANLNIQVSKPVQEKFNYLQQQSKTLQSLVNKPDEQALRSFSKVNIDLEKQKQQMVSSMGKRMFSQFRKDKKLDQLRSYVDELSRRNQSIKSTQKTFGYEIAKLTAPNPNLSQEELEKRRNSIIKTTFADKDFRRQVWDYVTTHGRSPKLVHNFDELGKITNYKIKDLTTSADTFAKTVNQSFNNALKKQQKQQQKQQEQAQKEIQKTIEKQKKQQQQQTSGFARSYEVGAWY